MRHRLDFATKIYQIEKSTGFKPGEYAGQSAGVQNSDQKCQVVLEFELVLNLMECVCSIKMQRLDPRDQMLSQKLLVLVGSDPLLVKTGFLQSKSA